MSRSALRGPVDVTLLDGPRLAAAIARVAPWTTPWRLMAVAALAVLALAAALPMLARPGALRGFGLLSLVAIAATTLAGIALRELGRAAAAQRSGREVHALRVALRPRGLPAFHLAMQPAWALASADVRWRITAAGCGLQLALAGVLAAVSPLWGGTTALVAALVNVALAAWTALTGERAFLARPPALRGAAVGRLEAIPTPPRPQRRGTARGDRGAAWFVLLAFGVPGALCSGFGAWQAYVQERRLRTAEPVVATVVATELTDRTQQKHGMTYRPLVRHRFEIDGRVHESVRLHPLPKGLYTDAAQAVLAAHPPGTRVLTHVPAGEPEGAYLVPLRQWMFAGMALFGLLFLVPALGVWRWLMRHARERGEVGTGTASDDATPAGARTDVAG